MELLDNYIKNNIIKNASCLIKMEKSFVEKNNIYNLDCKTLIKKMINQGFLVDLIITDPPYNISRKNNFSTLGRAGIDFGEWDKNFDQLSWLNNIGKILNKNGSIIIFNDWKNLGEIAKKLELEGFEIKDLIRWIKPAPMPRNVNRRYVTDFEFCIWAVKKGAKWTFNKNNELPYLKPKYEATVPQGSSRIHPTQKPEKLIEEIISVHSNVGDVIFDPFSGSGTISYVSKKLDRYFVGAEIDKKYYSLSLNRLDKLNIKPAFNHLGNKTRIIDELLRIFPKKNIENFVEPFAGSAIVTMSYLSAKKYWLNDKDKYLTSVLELLLNNDKDIIIKKIEKIIKDYDLPLENKSNKYKNQYNKLKDDYNNDKKVDKLLTLILFGFNQQIRFNKKNEFNIPCGKFFWNEYHKQKIIDFVSHAKNKYFETRSLDFENFIKEILPNLSTHNTLIYFDPPYLLSTATYNVNWDENDEYRLIKLLDELNKKGYKWVLSNVLISKGKTNKILHEFILNNNYVNYKIINQINYHNSNYQRKNKDDKDEEIIVWN